MIQLTQGGAYLVNGTDIVADTPEAASQIQAKTGITISREEAAKNTMAYGILREHNTSGNMDKLKIRFDKLTSHDITFVGIIQTARASGLQKFPMPYVLTNCHNSLCAVGGTINEDDHMFGLTCAKKYGGVYVPPHQAVIHQFAREMLAAGGQMILGSDSHTRYGALGTMAMGEGGPELVKQLLNQNVVRGLLIRNGNGLAFQLRRRGNIVACDDHIAITVPQKRQLERNPLALRFHGHFDKHRCAIDASGVKCIHKLGPSAIFHQLNVNIAILLLKLIGGFEQWYRMGYGQVGNGYGGLLL